MDPLIYCWGLWSWTAVEDMKRSGKKKKRLVLDPSQTYHKLEECSREKCI